MAQITAKLLPLSEITSTTLPGSVKNGVTYPSKKGFSVCGKWLNGSDEFETAEELHKHLIGKELMPSANGKSLVIVGSAVPVNTELLSKILVPRVELETVDLNDLI